MPNIVNTAKVGPDPKMSNVVVYFTLLREKYLIIVKKFICTLKKSLYSTYVLNFIPIGAKKRKVQGVPQSQTAAIPRPQEEEESDKSKQAQTKKMYEKH